jgi:hypothetical protein
MPSVSSAPIRWYNRDRTSASAIVAAGSLSIAHGLGVIPDDVILELRCLTAEAGYSVGNLLKINYSEQSFGSAGNYGVSIVCDATNINIRYGSTAAAFAIPNKTTGAGATITIANWELVARAWKS